MCQSKIFYLDMTYFPLKKSEYDKLKYYRIVNIVLLENVPQFLIQLIYLVSNGNNDGEPLSIVFITLILSILSILFNLSKLVTIFLFNNVSVTNAKRKYNYETKIGINFAIECDKQYILLRHQHCYMHNKISKAMKQTLDVSEYNNLWTGKSDIFYSIECYYIDNQSYYNKLVVYVNILVYTMALTNKNVITTLSETTINIMNKNTQIGEKFHNVCNTLMYVFNTVVL